MIPVTIYVKLGSGGMERIASAVRIRVKLVLVIRIVLAVIDLPLGLMLGPRRICIIMLAKWIVLRAIGRIVRLLNVRNVRVLVKHAKVGLQIAPHALYL